MHQGVDAAIVALTSQQQVSKKGVAEQRGRVRVDDVHAVMVRANAAHLCDGVLDAQNRWYGHYGSGGQF
jgi:hypothetical protein